MTGPIVARLVSWLLQRANADPPITRRAEFYALKDRLLRRYGACVDFDLQHIVDPCWGYERDGRCLGRGCRRCGGSGIWRERWIVLERWTLAGRVFHRPTALVNCPVALPRVIEGRIVHRDVNRHTAREAALWLALIFDRPLFVAMLRGGCYRGWHLRPLLALNAIVFPLSMKLSTHRCFCGRRFMTWGSGWQICARCRKERYARAIDATTIGGDDDLPF